MQKSMSLKYEPYTLDPEPSTLNPEQVSALVSNEILLGESDSAAVNPKP